MKIKQENKIALFSIGIIFSVFSLIKFLFFPDQSLEWHFITGVIGLVFILFFGFIVRAIDIYLDRVFPFERNIFKRIGLQFLITLTVLFVFRYASAYLYLDKMHMQVSRELWIVSFVINTFMVLSIILSIFGYHFFSRWKEEKIRAAELDREKALVQYDSLRNQLNPHFLFNALSSLNSLIFENPQLASDFLQQLSKVYRYVLENKEKNLVPLQTEINFVNHYVQLLKTRFDSAVEITYNLSDECRELKIVPVTLQVLFENAVKHNMLSTAAPLRIVIRDEDGMLVVENNVQRKQRVETTNGQGLENLANLYKYLSVRKVSIVEQNETFAVKIPLLP